jgi:antibiotic biosynthesis monooxygenase (ABM) superfamily enzyme
MVGNANMKPVPTEHQVPDAGASAGITHRVRESHETAYDDWLDEISPFCKRSRGHLDWHVIRPITGLTSTYTVVIRFDSVANLGEWMHSPERKAMINKVLVHLVHGDDYHIRNGLDFLFMPDGKGTKPPVRWKQFLVTWSAIYPLVLFVPLVVKPGLLAMKAPANHYLETFCITGAVVFLMVFLVMPCYTKLIRRWLFG